MNARVYKIVLKRMHVFTSENFGDRSGIIMSSSALSIVFTKLERFTGNGGSDLNTWLCNFERCFVIANKTEMILLMDSY